MDVMTMAQMIDHTLLKTYASKDDFKKLCEEAEKYHFKMVAINSYPVKMCREFLKDSPVHVGAAIGFPLGQTTIETKCFETEKAIEEGADEIDYVINVGKVKDGDYEYIHKEMQSITEICRKHKILIKVILETCYLNEEEIVKICEIAKDVKPDFVKTSTGFGTAGATVEHVKLMKSVVGDDVEVKAAGGIRTLDAALAMVEAGATRIGTSAGIAIVEEMMQRSEQ